jgi:hypothetical protein
MGGELLRTTYVNIAVRCCELGAPYQQLDWYEYFGIGYFKTNYEVHVKGNIIPVQFWTGPEISGRLRPPDFTTIDTL